MNKDTMTTGIDTTDGNSGIVSDEPTLFIETSQNPEQSRNVLEALGWTKQRPCTLSELAILPMGGFDAFLMFPSIDQKPALPDLLAERPIQERPSVMVLLPRKTTEHVAGWLQAGACACLDYDEALPLLPAHLAVISRKNNVLDYRITQCLRLDHLAQLGKSTAGLIHNLNNPMQVVMGMSEIQLMDRAEDRSALSIHQAARKVHLILAENCDRELNRLQESQTKVNLNELLSTVVNRLKSFPFFKHNLRLTLHFEDLPWLNCQYEPLLLAFNHLIRNASDSMLNSKDKALTISTRMASDGNVEVQIEDTGCGIAPEEMPRIFLPFVSSESFRQPDCIGLGAGLGLSFTKRILNQAGGTIFVESTPEKPGTTVRVILPVR